MSSGSDSSGRSNEGMETTETIEINATGELRGFTFTGFDGCVWAIRNTRTGMGAIRKALNNPLRAVYAVAYENRGKIVGHTVIVISSDGDLISHTSHSGKVFPPLLSGLPVRWGSRS